MRGWAPALGLTGLVVAVAIPLNQHARMGEAALHAAAVLETIHQAQGAFRAGAGRGGYASNLASLTSVCPGESGSSTRQQIEASRASASGYDVDLRAALDAHAVGMDCHQKPIVTNYYVAAMPRRNGLDGRQALAMTAEGRVFVFFDGVPPREADMAPGGLAVPLETLGTFKIP